MELVRGQNEAQLCTFTESALRTFRKCIRRQVVALEDLASVIDSTAPVSGLAEPGWEGCITCTGHAYGARRPADSSTSSLQAARATYFPDLAATELNLKGLAARESSSWVLFPGASRSLRMPAPIFGRIGWFAPIAWLVGSAARDPNQKEFPQVPPRRHRHGLTEPEEGRPLCLMLEHVLRWGVCPMCPGLGVVVRHASKTCAVGKWRNVPDSIG